MAGRDPRDPFGTFGDGSADDGVDPDATVFHTQGPGGQPAPGGQPRPGGHPTPDGGRGSRTRRVEQPRRAEPPPRRAAERSARPAPFDFDTHPGFASASDNPIVDAARLVFAVVGQLRLSSSAPDPRHFRQQMTSEIQRFDTALGAARVEQQTAMSARYALCSFIDETVQKTPWGSACGWDRLTLLAEWHGEAWGGERFFTIAQHALRDPAQYLHLLELLYLCLAFGFQGRFRIRDQGMAQLAEMQDAIYRAIRTQRGDGERELAQNWRGVEDKRNPIIRLVPLWVVGAVCALTVAAAFLFFRLTLGAQANPIELAINGIGRDTPQFGPPPAPLAVPTGMPRLKPFLEDEIAEGLVTAEEYPDRTVVRLNGDQYFASGSATIAPRFLPTLQRVADEINRVPGRVEVVGHSDNQPLRSLRFASNLELSRLRAEGVVAALRDFGVDPTRLSADGRADSEPVADNATAEGRALNRRVEIVVYEAIGHGSATPLPFTAPAR
ncbi:MAG: type VI secretion system protein TssL [Gammaproteobacteria bacterium]|nr:type VI secretion system protein TssL [Gammaproteobacteria bacterium]